MENIKGIEKENTARKKILKKAAMLATVASITGACAVGGQKPKESEALVGAIIAAITTVIGIGTSIGQSVSESVQAGNARRAEEEAARQEARRQEEEARKLAERQRIEAALESSEHNVRLNKTEELSNKTIDMSAVDNSSILEQQQQEEMQRARKRNNIKRPTAPPKGINIGGFGVEEVIDDNLENDVLNENVSDKNLNKIEDNNLDEKNTDVQEVLQKDNVDSEESLKDDNNSISSNIVRFDLNELGFGINSSEKTNKDTQNDIVEGFDKYEDNEDEGYVEFDESMLMLEDDALKHDLVKSGMLTAEELILLDFGVKNGAITVDILIAMYENGDISDEYYEGAIKFIEEINQ